MEREKREKQGRLLAGCLYLLYGAACCFLYYHMCLPEKGKYHSDLPAHIQSGMNGEAYSLLEILYKYICRAGFGSKVIPVLLTVLTLAAVYLSFRIMQQIVPDGNALALQLLAFAANLEMPLYLPLIHKYRNMGLQSGSMWHNDTYLGMRVFGLLVLLLYFRHQESYKETFKGRQWLAFAAAFFLANFMKPNFLLCFAPVMGILLLRDLIKSKGKDFRAVFWFGLAVIPSLGILNWDWFSEKIRKAGRPVKVLNLFAYTGGATLAAAAAGASVTHVDASKGMVNWAKENAQLSGLREKPIRWLVDDCVKFVEREIRRGNHYDGIIMDPPSYGRGPKGEIWKIEEKIYPFIELCTKILSDDPLFFLVNSYTTGLQPAVLTYMLETQVAAKFGGKVISDEIGLPVSSNGLVLPCGASGRWEK